MKFLCYHLSTTNFFQKKRKEVKLRNYKICCKINTNSQKNVFGTSNNAVMLLKFRLSKVSSSPWNEEPLSCKTIKRCSYFILSYFILLHRYIQYILWRITVSLFQWNLVSLLFYWNKIGFCTTLIILHN